MLMITSVKLTDFYKKIPNDPTEHNRNKVNNILNEFKLQRLLDDKTAKNLQTQETTTPNFCMQSEIHKEGNPNRPVIISVNCHTTQISQYFDHNLQPQVIS